MILLVQTRRRSVVLDLFLLLFVLGPVALVGFSLGVVIAFYGMASVPVYALARRGRGPSPGTVAQAVLRQSGRCFQWPLTVWRKANR